MKWRAGPVTSRIVASNRSNEIGRRHILELPQCLYRFTVVAVNQKRRVAAHLPGVSQCCLKGKFHPTDVQGNAASVKL